VLRDAQNNFVETTISSPVNLRELILFSSQAALPVTFGNFTAHIKGDQLLVNWTTLSEQNNSYFEVQVSKDSFT
jgi:hypothetical protein